VTEAAPSPWKLRRSGAVLVLCGIVALLIGMVYGTAAFLLPTHPELLPDWIVYAPEPGRKPPTLLSPAGAIFAFMVSFGVVALVLGFDMIVRGTRNRQLTRWLIVLCLVFVAVSMVLLLLGGETVPRLHL
jgi:hypothetical protein